MKTTFGVWYLQQKICIRASDSLPLLSCLWRLLHLPGEVDMVWQVVVQVRESNFVLCPDGLSDDDFVDVIKFIPVFIP